MSIAMPGEMHVVLLLDLSTDPSAGDAIDEAMIRGCLPPEATPLVLRLTEFGARRCSAGTPDNWLPVLSAIERMLRAARGADPDGGCRYWVAGDAALPAFFYLGYRLTRKAVVTLVHQGTAGSVEVWPLDLVGQALETLPPYFDRSPWPRRPSTSEAALAWIVSAGIRISAEQVEDAMSGRGAPPTPMLEAQASGSLEVASLGSAVHELDEQVAGIRTWYPRSASLCVFLAGPATLAFLAGRAINHHAFPDVQVFQDRHHRDEPAYEPAYETRSQRRKHIILFLASNPARTTRLALGEEAHDIEQELARSQYRDRFELQPQLAPRAIELRRHLQVLEPSVVHFSGHGDPGGLVFHHDDGSYRIISPDDLGDTFRTAGVRVKVAVLSGCFTELQAEALLEHVDCVVGMPGPFPDDAARSFAVGFYEALGDRTSVQTAYELGCLAMRLPRPPRDPNPGDTRAVGPEAAPDPGGDERTRPRLLVRPGVDAGTLVLDAGPD